MIVAPLSVLVALVVILSFFVLWGVAFIKLVNGQPLLAYEPRRPVPWGLLDLVLVVLVLVLSVMGSSYFFKEKLKQAAEKPSQKKPAAAENAAEEKPAGENSTGWRPGASDLTLEQNMLLIIADAAMKLTVMVVVTPIVMLRNGCTLRDMGIVPSKVGRDIRIGLATFCMLAPIVFTIQALLTQLEPYKHPLIEMLSNTPDLRLFGLLFFSAAFIAPLSEEWAFRLLLQGWLEKMLTYTGNPLHILIGGLAPAEPIVIDDGNASPPLPSGSNTDSPSGITYLPPAPAQAAGIQWLDPANPYAPPPAAVPLTPNYQTTLAKGFNPEFSPPPHWKQWAPIFVSAIIFALMHYSHGLAWIPLTLLAIGLGYIYQRTHSILPSIVVHFCLNALSTAAIWVQMFEAPQ